MRLLNLDNLRTSEVDTSVKNLVTKCITQRLFNISLIGSDILPRTLNLEAKLCKIDKISSVTNYNVVDFAGMMSNRAMQKGGNAGPIKTFFY